MNTLDLDTLTLAAGCHDPGDEMCVMEAVAFIAGEEWSDRPECELQQSAHEMVDRMLAVTEGDPA